MTPPRKAIVAVCVAALLLTAGCGEAEKGDDAAPTTTRDRVTASTTTSTTKKELTAKSRVRLDGIGPIVMEMSLAEATEEVGRRVAVDPDSLISGEESPRRSWHRLDREQRHPSSLRAGVDEAPRPRPR